MTTAASGERDHPVLVVIRVRGRLDARWVTWFSGMDVTPDADGTTTLRGVVADQAALHGVLSSLRDLGIPLLSVLAGVPSADPPIPAP